MKTRMVCVMAGVALLAACARVTVEPFDLAGSKADGTVIIGANVPEFGDVNWAGAATMALKRCQAWGYSATDAFSGMRTQCIRGGGWSGCSEREISRTYQCLD